MQQKASVCVCTRVCVIPCSETDPFAIGLQTKKIAVRLLSCKLVFLLLDIIRRRAFCALMVPRAGPSLLISPRSVGCSDGCSDGALVWRLVSET